MAGAERSVRLVDGGPLTLAVSLRGHELLTDLYEDPEYVRTLLDYLTEVTIARVRAHARFFGMPIRPTACGLRTTT